MTPRISIILSSTRDNRFGEKVARWAESVAEKRTDMQVELVDLKEWDLPLFHGANPPSSGKYDDVQKKWAAKIAQADGFLIVTPEYNHGYPGQLKNALDHLYTPWNYKPVAFLSYGGPAGGARAVEQLTSVAVELRMIPLRDSVALSLVGLALDEQGGPKSEFFGKRAATMCDELCFWAGAAREVRARKT